MTKHQGYTMPIHSETLTHCIKWLGWPLVIAGSLFGLLFTHQSHLLMGWENAMVGGSIGLCCVLMGAFTRMKRATPPLSSIHLDQMGFVARASCAVAGAFCAWAGIWPLTCALWGLSLTTLPDHRARYALFHPLSDNGDALEGRIVPAGTLWAQIVMNGDGVDVIVFHGRPGNLNDEALSRILVECHQNQLRALTWPEGISVDDEPGRLAVLVEDVLNYRLQAAGKEGTSEGDE